jgi:hypothetical protein
MSHVVILACPTSQAPTIANELNGKFMAPQFQLVISLIGGQTLARARSLFAGSQNVPVLKPFLVRID